MPRRITGSGGGAMLTLNLIDPDLVTDLQDLTSRYAEAQQSADKIKWQIAQKVTGYLKKKGLHE